MRQRGRAALLRQDIRVDTPCEAARRAAALRCGGAGGGRDRERRARRGGAAGKTRLSFAPFNAKNVIILPRQARDKHRVNSQKEYRFLQVRTATAEEGGVIGDDLTVQAVVAQLRGYAYRHGW